MHLPQPSGIGRRPANVSADSMLVTPELKPEDLYPIRRYKIYTPPPKGYFYETKDSNNVCGNPIAKNRTKSNRFGNKTESRDIYSDPPPFPNLYLPETFPAVTNAIPYGGRPICKSYNQSYHEGN